MKAKIITLFAFSLLSHPALASQIHYKPSNPSFGGSSFNSSHLISLANEQKAFEDPKLSIPTQDPLEEFSRTVQRSLLSRLSQDIADQILGDEATDSGQFLVGDTTLNFERVNGQVIIDISDAATGGKTTIQVPIPQ